MHLHQRLDCIHRVNTKYFAIQNPAWEERNHNDIERKLDFHCIHCKVVSYRPFLIASSFYILEEVKKNWTVGRPVNNATANQVCSNLLPPHPTKHFRRFIASNRYTANKQTQNPFSCHLAFTRITYSPKLHWSRLQTTFRKWFMNQITNWLLSGLAHLYQAGSTEPSLGTA